MPCPCLLSHRSQQHALLPAPQVADHTDARQYIDTRHHAHIHNHREYDEMYKRSIEDPNGFWREIAMKEFHWETPVPEQHHNYNFDVRKVRCVAHGCAVNGCAVQTARHHGCNFARAQGVPSMHMRAP